MKSKSDSRADIGCSTPVLNLFAKAFVTGIGRSDRTGDVVDRLTHYATRTIDPAARRRLLAARIALLSQDIQSRPPRALSDPSKTANSVPEPTETPLEPAESGSGIPPSPKTSTQDRKGRARGRIADGPEAQTFAMNSKGRQKKIDTSAIQTGPGGRPPVHNTDTADGQANPAYRAEASRIIRESDA